MLDKILYKRYNIEKIPQKRNRGEEMNKKIMLSVGAVVMALTIGLAACNGEGGASQLEAARLPRTPNYGSEVAVHDPSIFKDDDGTYYAFGTHYAVAKSTDLMSWTQYASDGQWQKLYDATTPYTHLGRQWPKAIEDTVKAVNPKDKGNDTIGTTWAPDVIKLGSKYYMYYSLTDAFGSRGSAIARVEASSVTGPYSDNVVLFKTGKEGDPNGIDPTVFYDKEGKLWMVFGSAFGGINIIELNASGKDIGLPTEEEQALIDSGLYGETIWQASDNNAEGPYIFYNEQLDYYYLMCSYGDLNTTYNMRVARSKNPNGPYEDIDGTDVSSDSTAGNKLAGNYQFNGGEVRVGLGHNSVLVEDGKYLVVSHVRNALSGMHHLEVHQLFFNEDGWPVLSPNRYAGEELGRIDADDVAGKYDLILHSEGITTEIVASEEYTFMADGSVMKSADNVGTWELSGDYYITVTIGENEYKGVIAPSYIDYNSEAGYTITAMATKLDYRNALWANPVKGG